MNIETTAAFAAAFFLLALTPGAGLAMILSRTLRSGVVAGFSVTTGLILADFIFLGLAIAGLTALAATMGPMFQIVKYAGAFYLIWLGYKALTVLAKPITMEPDRAKSGRRDIAMGLFVTLGNPKPIFFYSSLVPTFLDVSKVDRYDYFVLGGLIAGISYLVYGSYILLIRRARRVLVSHRSMKRLNQVTGAMFIGSGILVATR